MIQVLINILNNAKDELEKKDGKKLIFLNIYKENNNAIIKIKDNAGGIPQEILPNVFDAYFTTKENNGGTGIGLHMSKKIIMDNFKGILEVNNQQYSYDGIEYTGAQFKIVLPLMKSK